MNKPINLQRLIVELVAALILVQVTVMLALPMIAPGVDGVARAVLHAALLGLIAAPIMVWRIRVAQSAAVEEAMQAQSTLARSAGIASTGVLIAGLAVTLMVVSSTKAELWKEFEGRFDRRSERLVHEAQQRVNQIRYGLAGLRGAWAAAGRLDRAACERYVLARDLPKDFPGALGMGVIERVQREDLPAFIAAQRADAAPEFEVWSLAEPGSALASQPDLYVITSCFPVERNASAWGLDVGSEQHRRAAIERAIATGKPTITQAVTLVQDQGEGVGFLYYLPVYDDSLPNGTPEERFAALQGVVYAPLLMEQTLQGMVMTRDDLVEVEIYDGPSADPARLLYHYAAKQSHTDASNQAGGSAAAVLTNTSCVGVDGRTWTIVTKTTPAFEAMFNGSVLPIIGVGGCFLSMLAAWAVYAMMTVRVRAQAAADRMTEDLRLAKASADRLAEIAKRTSNAIIIADAQGRVEWVNQAFTRVSGYTLEEVRGRKPGHMLGGPRTDPIASRTLGEAQRTGSPARVEIINYAKDGREYVLDIELAPLRDEAGAITGFMAIESDITERVLAHRRILESEQRLRTIFEAEPECVKVLGLDGSLQDMNAAGLAMLECESVGQVREHGLERFVLSEHRDAFCQAFGNALGGEPATATFEIMGRKGTRRWMDTSMVPMRDAAGTLTAILAVTRDITQLRRQQEDLKAAKLAAEAASLAKSEFLANMSHEIRTPLTAILGFADVLREDGDLAAAPASRLTTIETIRTAGQHLMTVINDILDLSKIEAGRMALENIETPLVEILREVESLMLPRAQGKGITFAVRLRTPTPDRILSDPTRLRQILLNLLGNATKFTEHGAITVEVEADEQEDDPKLCIDVVDTGIGMTQEQVQRLFANFSQADTSTTRKHGGTGLGLVICRRLANLMGGDVKLLHSEPGRGSCFRLVLPLQVAPTAARVERLHGPQSPSESAATGRPVVLSGRILLAEDGPDNQRLISFHLRKAGAVVEVAEHGKVALEMIRAAAASGTPFDLLVTDMQMPEMDGYSLAATLRAEGNHMPIIALTAHAMSEDRARCLSAGCDDYASKPIDKAKLLGICAKWLANQHNSVQAKLAA